jgi:hypothetical protein
LYEPPQGASKTINEWALSYSTDAQEARLLQDKLLKSGKLSMRDYLTQRQNLMDGTTQAFSLVKEAQDIFKGKWDRRKSGESQYLEQFIMEEMEGFGNFEKTRLYINPLDGKVSVAHMEEEVVDGNKIYKMSSNPNKFSEISILRNRIKTNFDNFNVQDAMKGFVEGLGEEIKTVEIIKNNIDSTGLISEVLDITKRENLPESAQGVINKFEAAETKILQSYLANPYNTSSILTENLRFSNENNEQYNYTWSESDAKSNPNLILLKNENGMVVPKFTAGQEKDALEYLRTQARMMYDKKEQTKVTPQLDDAQFSRYKAQKELEQRDRQLDITESQGDTQNANETKRLSIEERKVRAQEVENFNNLAENRAAFEEFKAKIQGYSFQDKNGIISMNKLADAMSYVGSYGFDYELSNDGNLMRVIFPNGGNGEVIDLSAKDASSRVKTELLSGMILSINNKGKKEGELD